MPLEKGSGSAVTWRCGTRCRATQYFLTGTGVNDSHGGPWKSQKNTFLTWA